MRQQGMVLMTTLMTIVIITLLVLSLLQGMLLYSKISYRMLLQHEGLYQQEMVVRHLMASPPNCVIPEEDPNQVMSMLLSEEACKLTIHENTYRYLMSDLGAYPFLWVQQDNKRYATHHWLISVSDGNTLLQWRVAKRDDTPVGLSTEGHDISLGVLSWRRIPHLKGTA